MIKPQEGPQTAFLESEADIVVYGGHAGAGKSYGLILYPLYHKDNEDFSAVAFRRTNKQVRAPGGLWDTARSVYSKLKAKSNITDQEWTFPAGAKVKFAHLQYLEDVYEWDGSQIPLIMFDELIHFLEEQFFYLLSRNRSTCKGINPYIRATTNPNANSWVKVFLAPWVDEEWPEEDKAKSGEIRYFVRINEITHWAKTPEELIATFEPIIGEGEVLPKSCTFIEGEIYDNKILLENSPGYLASLHAMSHVEKERLLKGSWSITEAGNMFKNEWIYPLTDRLQVPTTNMKYVRYWDLAGGQKKTKSTAQADMTAGVLLGLHLSTRTCYVLDAVMTRETPGKVDQMIMQTAKDDKKYYGKVLLRIERDPGGAGIHLAEVHASRFKSFNFRSINFTGDKVTRAKGVSAYCEHGRLKIIEAPWAKRFISILTAFPDVNVVDDPVDALSGAYNVLLYHIQKAGKYVASEANETNTLNFKYRKHMGYKKTRIMAVRNDVNRTINGLR